MHFSLSHPKMYPFSIKHSSQIFHIIKLYINEYSRTSQNNGKQYFLQDHHPSKELKSLLNDPIVLGHHILLTGHRNAPVLQGVVCLPEEILPVILQALIERSHDSDTDHRANEAAHRRDLPILE